MKELALTQSTKLCVNVSIFISGQQSIQIPVVKQPQQMDYSIIYYHLFTLCQNISPTLEKLIN